MQQIEGIKIALVDDEPNILQFLKIGLENEGFEVVVADNGMEAISTVKEFQPHVVILDVMMPGMDGFEVCKMLKKTENVSIIMLTARDEVDDRVKGLTLGADDYMAKPFSFEELIARIYARVRNQFPHLFSELVFGSFLLDDRRKEIKHHNTVLDLSATEYSLLRYMILHHDSVLSKSVILDKVWGYDFGGDENIVEVYIRSLREKLHDKEHTIIKTLRGQGYRIDVT